MTYLRTGDSDDFASNGANNNGAEIKKVENDKGIENHIKAGEHFALASRHHYEAARFHGEGLHEKANECALFAIGHACLANEYQLQDTKHHILEVGSIT